MVHLLYVNIFLIFVLLAFTFLGLPKFVLYFVMGMIILVVMILIVSYFYFFVELLFTGRSFVPFVASDNKKLSKMMEIANIQKNDQVYDLGCGDGKIILEASKYTNKKCIGYERKLDVALFGKLILWLKSANAEIIRKDFFKENLEDADVIFVYLLPNVMKELEPKILKECKKGTKVISNGFEFPNWTPENIYSIKKGKVIEYIVQ
ncbi:hypothetical protein [Candidatus Absconditicoccus praedator]|uniref:hypothetical protein n=1 Tax=Candidatus Absconditicoccus praedator TaxID=2735562 RepID=UPI001E375A49|nr:hypothetical protein [Candidatus Absconditicoccus praedator]UFX82940.1 hypothetical protein HLG78_02290 [Candidatus Absconditicoccus praedator]